MPAFTAIGVAVATGLGFGVAAGTAGAIVIGGASLTLAGALVASVVAAGAAAVVSRLINGGGSGSGSGGTTQDPGVRVQLPPATDNKVPIIYGTANTKGVVTDARISDDNQQMTYVLILSEKTQTGTFTVGDIFWNDQLLTFDTGSNNHKVASSRDQNGLGATNTNYAGLIEMRVYAGSAQTSASQIFPTTNAVSAVSYIGETTSTYVLNDLVYAVVKLTYSSEKGVTALQQTTFEVQNSLSNPGLVLYDYLTSGRYGAGIDVTQIDTVSMTSTVTNTSLYSIANEIPPNQFESDGTTSTQARYITNGVLSTGETVKNNLEKITQASASWLTYDFVQGKWTVVPNRALSVGELAALVTYDDDSIIGEVNVNATNLEDLYDSIEVEFPSREIRDQNDYYRASIAKQNELQPDNTLSLRYDLINNAIHAQRLGQIELQQSAVDKSIQFKTTYEGLQTKAGDVIKVTNEVYGFTDKLFRVTRVREIENEDGSLFAEISGLEYDADVYGDTNITDYQPNTASGIPSFGGPVSLPRPGVVVVGNTFATNNNPYFEVSTTISPAGGGVDQILWYYKIGAGDYVYVTNEVGPFSPGQTVTDDIAGLPAGSYSIYARVVKDGLYSDYSFDDLGFPPTNDIVWNPQPGGVNNGTINTSTFSSQINTILTSTNTLKIPLVTATSGFQPIYVDNELGFDATTNQLQVGGQGASLNFTNTGTRILGLFDGSVTNRTLIQTRNTNSVTQVGISPNGTTTAAGTSAINFHTLSDPTNSPLLRVGTSALTETFINSTRNGSVEPFLPLNMYVAGRQVFNANTTTGLITIANGIQTTAIGYNTGTTTISHTLQRQNSQPAYFITGTMAVANGTGWNPTQEPTGTPPYLTYYNGTEWRAIGQPTVYAQIWTTATSTISTVTQSQIISFTNIGPSYGITNTTATTITLNGPGVYNVMFSAQFTNSGANAEYAYIWLRQNGVDVADSNSIFSIPAKHGARDGALIGTVDFLVNATSNNEWVQLAWAADSTTVSLPTVAAGTSPTRPRTPAVIVTVMKIK